VTTTPPGAARITGYRELPMAEDVLIVNTHPGENPRFVGKLREFLISSGSTHNVIDGYTGLNPLDSDARRIILTGVPLDVDYSLSEYRTRKLIDRAFGWLHECTRPVLGICYGHQILARVYGGQVSSLEETVLDPRHPIVLSREGGVFSGVKELKVFAEHRDYVSVVPGGFTVLSRRNEIPYIMYDPNREMYGVQFVPEQSDDRTKEILRRFALEWPPP
jgi:GMP synthase-like glutamine amidotransferase